MSNSLIFPWSENVTGNVVFKQAQTVVILSAILENVIFSEEKKLPHFFFALSVCYVRCKRQSVLEEHRSSLFCDFENPRVRCDPTSPPMECNTRKMPSVWKLKTCQRDEILSHCQNSQK